MNFADIPCQIFENKRRKQHNAFVSPEALEGKRKIIEFEVIIEIMRSYVILNHR